MKDQTREEPVGPYLQSQREEIYQTLPRATGDQGARLH